MIQSGMLFMVGDYRIRFWGNDIIKSSKYKDDRKIKNKIKYFIIIVIKELGCFILNLRFILLFMVFFIFEMFVY